MYKGKKGCFHLGLYTIKKEVYMFNKELTLPQTDNYAAI